MAPTDRYRDVSALPVRLPVFPLRGAIVLPRASLPLNVFEPRYLQLIDDVLAGNRLVGIIQPERSETNEESPAGSAFGLRRVGCAARLTAFQERDDGRLLITLTGVCRFVLGEEQAAGRPYRVFKVDFSDYASDLVRGAGEDRIDREMLLNALKRYLDARRMKADWQGIANAPAEHLINMLSIISPYGAEEKQALLEAADLETRAGVLVTLVEMDLASGEGGAGSTMQ